MPETLKEFIEKKEKELVAYEDKIRDLPEDLKIEGRRGFLAGRLRECAEKTVEAVAPDWTAPEHIQNRAKHWLGTNDQPL